jgi:uncharacterized membrane protein (DUF4010 family)
MVLLRLTVMAALVAPAIIEPLAKVFTGGLVLGLAVTAFGWRRLEAQGELPMPEVRNPTEIRTALGFGALYAVVLFCSAWLSDVAGAKGMYAVALASGLTDVDAITLSSLRLFSLDKLSAGQAVTSIALAVLSNLTFKAGLVITLGGWALARRTLPAMLAVAAGIGFGLFLV